MTELSRKTFKVLSTAITLCIPFSCMNQHSAEIDDFILLEAESIQDNFNSADKKFNRWRIGKIVILPYLIQLDYSSRKLEVVAYAEKGVSTPIAIIVKVYLGGTLDPGNGEQLVFKAHPNKPYQWARYLAFSRIDESKIKGLVVNGSIPVIVEVEVEGESHSLHFKLIKRTRRYITYR